MSEQKNRKLVLLYMLLLARLQLLIVTSLTLTIKCLIEKSQTGRATRVQEIEPDDKKEFSGLNWTDYWTTDSERKSGQEAWVLDWRNVHCDREYG